jgi:hypothetical protein
MMSIEDLTEKIRALALPGVATEEDITACKDTAIRNAMEKAERFFWQPHLKDKGKTLRTQLTEDSESEADMDEEDDEEEESHDQASVDITSNSGKSLWSMTGEEEMTWGRDNVQVVTFGNKEEHPHVSEYFGDQWDAHIVSQRLCFDQ